MPNLSFNLLIVLFIIIISFFSLLITAVLLYFSISDAITGAEKKLKKSYKMLDKSDNYWTEFCHTNFVISIENEIILIGQN